MVGAHDFGVDRRIRHASDEGWRNAEVIDPPADVALPRSAPVRPPRIGVLFVGIKVAEGVDEPAVEQLGKARALLVGEPGGPTVFPWAREVDLVVGDVEVAAEDDGLANDLLTQAQPVGQAAEAVLRVDGVDVDEVEIRILQGDDAAFLVVLPDPHAVTATDRHVLGEDRSP